MSLTEFNEEKYMEMIKRERYEDGFDDGHTKGFDDGHAKGFSDGLAKGYNEGVGQGAIMFAKKMVETGIITLESAAEQLGIPVEKMEEVLKDANSYKKKERF